MESGLSRKVSEIRQEVGHFLGYTRDDTNWSSQQLRDLNECLRSGFSRFYNTTPILGQAYEWSFLKVQGSMVLQSGKTFNLLPQDFGSPDGEFYLEGTTNLTGLKLMNHGFLIELQARYSTNEQTGIPTMVAVMSDRGAGIQGQRKKLLVWRTPGSDYTVRYAYNINVDMALDNEYPYGGSAHSETILESCLAVAEQKIDDAMGIHTAAFERLLTASVNSDRKLKTGSLGSMNRGGYRGVDRFRIQNHRASTVTFV